VLKWQIVNTPSFLMLVCVEIFKTSVLHLAPRYVVPCTLLNSVLGRLLWKCNCSLLKVTHYKCGLDDFIWITFSYIYIYIHIHTLYIYTHTHTHTQMSTSKNIFLKKFWEIEFHIITITKNQT